jgi:hypothetical protein
LTGWRRMMQAGCVHAVSCIHTNKGDTSCVDTFLKSWRPWPPVPCRCRPRPRPPSR